NSIFFSLIERRCSSLPNSPAKRVSPAKKKQFFISQAIRNSDLTPRAKGRKSQRRQENTRFLDNLLERDDCSKEDSDVHETASPSIFTEACTNENYVEYWSDFMNRSGEEQERLLALLEEEAQKTHFNKTHKDQREEKGVLEGLESGLLGFFVAHPNSVYITKLCSSYERLLLHAICQYMDLTSASE
ncbi:hypothetical protein DNTS_008217, partial [Danionella cerebrum]